MLKRLSLTVCLLVALAVAVAGCGSSETASTAASTTASQAATTASQSTGTTKAPETTSKPGPPKISAAAQAKLQSEKETAKRNLEAAVNHTVSPAVAEAVLRKTKRIVKPDTASGVQQRIAEAKRQVERFTGSVPVDQQFTTQEQIQFMTDCEYGKGSHSACKCVLVKQELHSVKTGSKFTGRSLAELLALDFALQQGALFKQATGPVPFPAGGSQRLPLPSGIRQSIKECLS